MALQKAPIHKQIYTIPGALKFHGGMGVIRYKMSEKTLGGGLERVIMNRSL